MLNKIRNYWSNIEPEKKRHLIITVLIIIGVIFSYFFYVASGRGVNKEEDKNKVETPKERVINFDADKYQKSMYEQSKVESAKEKEKVDKAIEAFRKELQDFKTGNIQPPPKNMEAATQPDAPHSAETNTQQGFKIPPPPPSTQAGNNLFTAPPSPTTGSVPPPPPPPPGQTPEAQAGGIEIISANSQTTPGAPTSPEAEKKKGLYLPPSFMEGMLLSGVIAPTSSTGKSQPVPMLIRIKNLAILPNSVRANLKGCFVIAEGVGNLASERVMTRLITLSCFSKNGQSIIDQEIKGFVVDADGQVDLKGRVVSKMGIHLARVGLAGFLGGVGKAMEESTKDSQFSPATGITSTQVDTDPESLAKLGLGSGVASTAKALQDFYLELAQQTIPVVEVGPTKRVNLVISKGVDLNIMKANTDTKITAKNKLNADGAVF